MKKILVFWLAVASAFAQKSRPQRIVTFTPAGTANAITGTPSPALSAYTDLATNPLTQVCFVAAATSTGSITINLHALGAKALKKVSAGTISDAGADDIVNGQYTCFVYLSGPDYFILPGASGGGSGGSGGTLTWATPIGTRMYAAGWATTVNLWNVSVGNDADFDLSLYTGTDATGTATPFLQMKESGDTSFTWVTTVPIGYTSGTLSLAMKRWNSVGSGDVRWSVRTYCLTTTPVYATAMTFNTATLSTETVSATTPVETNIATGVDMTGCTAGGPLLIRVERFPADALDTNTGAVNILSLKAAL